jgi:hypothetical protein
VDNIVADALSILEKDDDEKLSETEEGLLLSHAMCAVEQDEATVMPETKEELVRNIMNLDEMESEEFPMIPEIIDHEQKKDIKLKEVMKKSEFLLLKLRFLSEYILGVLLCLWVARGMHLRIVYLEKDR